MKSKKKAQGSVKHSDGNTQNRKPYSIIFFGLYLLFACIVCIPGESLWLVLHNFVLGMLGFCAVLWPVLLIYFSIIAEVFPEKKNTLKIWLSSGFIITLSCEFYLFSVQKAVELSQIVKHLDIIYKLGGRNCGPGVIGAVIGNLLALGLGISGARAVNIILIFMLLMILTGVSLNSVIKNLCYPFILLKNRYESKKQEIANQAETNIPRNGRIDIPLGGGRRGNSQDEFESPEEETKEIAQITQEYVEQLKGERQKKDQNPEKKKNKLLKQNSKIKQGNLYDYPPINLLHESGKIEEHDIKSELQSNGQALVDTLKSFNVKTKIIAVSRGPAVTRYELQPASGVKISKITNLAADIALNLAATGVRIEAPIPGKAAVGVEVPNKVINPVNMRELIESPVFKAAKSKLTVVLGRDISGKVIVADLADMPHLLIAGSTGSGKSVCINSFIVSLLYKASPDEVKLIMIDPKVVELSVYNGIPHLLIPVVTDPRKAKGALSWAVTEMMHRYKIFAENNVRDMHSYNRYLNSHPEAMDEDGNPCEKMYSMVIIIDELSDLMMAAPNEVEDYICRLAQMARAAGIHLVIATQRPSVDVITGIIKANIPSRIALAVSSQIDSRTILDMGGAETLLGKGDMLFSPIGSSKPKRIQGCYVTDREIEEIVNYIKPPETEQNEYNEEVIDQIEKNADIDKGEVTAESGDDGRIDPVLKEAIQCVVETGQASASFLQRRLRVGYARAGRLIDEMEKLGIVGPHEGSKPRQVLINYEQFLEMNANH